MSVIIDRERDGNLTEFGKAILRDRYLLTGEEYQDLFVRVAKHYSDDKEHAQRLYNYMSKLWFMPATPILSNGGTTRGMPISCFLNEVHDSLEGIVSTWNENVWLASHGGGIGTYWGGVRSIGEKVKGNGKTSGIIPFIAVQDKLALAISQGSLRRGSSAVYLPVSHPEIEEFIELRRPTGGDFNRRSLNLHHGVMIPDAFMNAVAEDGPWALKSPVTGQVISVLRARDIWIRILIARIETGEPYIVFEDRVRDMRPEVYKKNNLDVKTSNLCSEITLSTGLDQFGNQRTAVCCLSSLNLEKYDEWKDDDCFIYDIMRMLDNVLQDYIDNAPDTQKNARYAAYRERSVGLGVMGFHSFLQSKMVPLESVVAKSWNKRVFGDIKNKVDEASRKLADERGACPDAQIYGIHERFSHKTAIAPTASISIIAANCSPGIEPYSANTYMQKTLTGSFNVENKYLKRLLAKKGMDTQETWSNIMQHEGSVQHLDFLSEDEKAVFKTAFEINQRWMIELAADRTPYICQSQSLNIFLPADIYKKDLHMLHFEGWLKGLKSFYYCRSKSLQRPDSQIRSEERYKQLSMAIPPQDTEKYEECLSCQ
ncbi:Ribonucleoside-diphosphate reductase subunit alpha [Candidatus Cyrtobacter comes]|uniref:Ribonucleoside-diphosphate reductase n=1 Tax=Candidatus Cyrtobacter comes TaxID=675776 RepID=A0ABU5L878_9RICK|nr:ribonucleoside-diphosphate reductase subunit alpha [Candidatus Cyrtobacter comes]MDZ5762334.1 Ribonucleoside-diphosphate reductase subunit alpha [Candidatus Cyrtobacter comes]